MFESVFPSNEFKDYRSGLRKEWIVTNGLGGYASSTITGANSRTYHGLLVAAMNPPVDRILLLSSVDEIIEINGELYHLAVHKYPDTVYPEGYRYLNSVSFNPFPVYTYNLGNARISKHIFMVHGQNTTIIEYQIDGVCDNDSISMKLLPLINTRNFHHTARSNDNIFKQTAGSFRTEITNGNVSFQLSSNAGYFPAGNWYYDFEYEHELERGNFYTEDNYNPGYFEKSSLTNGSHIFLVASTEHIPDINSEDIEILYRKEIERLIDIERKCSYKDNIISKLYPAADSFIVQRKSTGSNTVIAGYHWFSDWGRDSMISLPGLTLVTGRFEEASSILTTFSKYCRRGLIPNRFPDHSKDMPAYNTVDAPLWFIHAAGRYFEYTGDGNLIEDIWSTIKEILYYYTHGTDNGIIMDSDGLIRHNDQLTWMDAKIGVNAVTPRAGKACEINALWYNALNTALFISDNLQLDIEFNADDLHMIRENFSKMFWNTHEKCLFDFIDDRKETSIIKDPSIRPNQLFAVSLPYTMLTHKQNCQIVKKVEQELLTPVGIRTLSPGDSGYTGIYSGNIWTRDAAYHNGTVWPWLMGAYISAYTRVNNYSDQSIAYSEQLLQGLDGHLYQAGVGTISEIFDGDPPHDPKGCISQAWSVAEIMRAYIEDIVNQGKVKVMY
ncbi:glycogen debranching enzyme [Methanosalsum zhilinae DSM 4017]|uniref:Glycogen debranching enzyme n=1 Tax=Methanosalsum zhilinae (strain DSM 4017 / NBRC 107636 / OCM 62 / WeN5) TaxID=679901 RepID=F7XM25_METZD|nr:amylo-alpha-1,6-glucosidase [Methanosalsum zhilinae]AEH61232.1 glycogen debranching enzyme [Methanosalsum zhilinae DSM 4017]